MKSKMYRTVFVCSLLLNLLVVLGYFWYEFNSPTGQLGQLTREVHVGGFADPGTTFRLPAGLTVEDVSPRGFSAAGQFEPNRFAIIFTTDQRDVVDYSPPPDSIQTFGPLYSIRF